MAQLRIGDKVVQVDDSFLRLKPEEQNAVVEEITASLGLAKEAAAPETKAPAAPAPSGEGGVTAPNVIKAALRGVPILGGGMNQAAAAIDAATQPVLGGMSGSQAPTFAERRAANLAANQQNEKAFSEESPIASTAAEVGGGVAALLPAAATQVGAKILGMSGTLPQMVTRGATSGAAINAADAAVRGENPVTAAEVGGGLGAVAPVIGRGIGKTVQAVRRAVAPAPPLAQQVAQTIDVNGNPIRMSQSQMTGDAAQSAEEQVLARGGRGEAAQQEAQNWRAGQQGEVRAAEDSIAAELDPARRSASTTPGQAAEAVSAELGTAERAREGAAARATAAAAQEGQDIRMAAGGGQTVADAPYTAGEILSQGLQQRAGAARAARTAAYDAARNVDIEISPAALDRADVAIADQLRGGPDRVRLNERTPRANEALQTIRETIQAGFEPVDAARGPALTRGPNGQPVRRNVTGTDIDELRKDLIAMQRQANAAARSTGDNTDVRAMQRIIDAYETTVEHAARVGTVRGDPDRFLSAIAAARQSHRDLRQTFGARGPQDEAGKIIEKMLGRGGGEPAAPGQIATWAYGPEGSPGGATAIKVAQRLHEIFGDNSREWAAYRQGLLAHLTEVAPGTEARTAAQTAERVHEFLTGTKGRGLAQIAFSPGERQRLAAHATQLRATAPQERPTDVVSRVMSRISGADGALPASVNEITGYLYGSGAMGDKRVSVQLARRLKTELTPESWTAVKQGMWTELTQAGEGLIEYGPQKLSQRLHNFLNGDGKQLAEEMFTQRERNLMGQMADVYKRMIPVEGSTNPSGTAPMLAKIVGKLNGVLLPLLGFSHGGMAGAAAGVAAQKGIERVVTRKAVRETHRRFYGEQPRATIPPAATSRIPALLVQGGSPSMTR